MDDARPADLAPPAGKASEIGAQTAGGDAVIDHVDCLSRGSASMESKLQTLGAHVERIRD